MCPDRQGSPSSRSDPETEVALTVLLPCLNEAASVARCVTDAAAALVSLGILGEVLVVDNGSVDGSGQLAEAAGGRVVHASRRGYGAAVRCGVDAARGSYVVVADADATYDLASLPLFWARLQAGDELVIGDRFAGGIEAGAMPRWNRYVGNPLLSAVARASCGAGVRDFHCGIRAFRRQSIESLCLQSDGMELATEMIVKAARAGLTIGQVPTRLRAELPGRRSHLRPVRDGVRHLWLIWQLRRA